MKQIGQTVGMFLLVSSLGTASHVFAADGVISKQESTPGSYCHMKFPAMDEKTLASDHPTLKDDGDVIDFYGPCNEAPTGKDQVAVQKLEEQHRWEREYEDRR